MILDTKFVAKLVLDIATSAPFNGCCDVWMNSLEKVQNLWLFSRYRYRTRANRTPTFYLLNQFFGPDFEISDCKCKNAYKTSANHNETSSIYFSYANSSKNNIEA